MTKTRRAVLVGLGSLLVAAPATVRAASLMPVRSYVKPGDWWLDVGGIRETYNGRTWRVYWGPVENIVDRNWLAPGSKTEGFISEDFIASRTVTMEIEDELSGVKRVRRIILRPLGETKP